MLESWKIAAIILEPIRRMMNLVELKCLAA